MAFRLVNSHQGEAQGIFLQAARSKLQLVANLVEYISCTYCGSILPSVQFSFVLVQIECDNTIYTKQRGKKKKQIVPREKLL